MSLPAKLFLSAALACATSYAVAETYKCFKGGQTVYSDIPCAAGAERVDSRADVVSKDQRRQAESQDRANKRMLWALENQAVRDRYTPRKVGVLPR